jgi:ketosteroid isomerase-like protein
MALRTDTSSGQSSVPTSTRPARPLNDWPRSGGKATSENLGFVRSILADWERGEFGRTADWAHPEIEFVVADGPEPGRWFGLAGAEEGGGAILSPFANARIEAEEYRELDGERVLVLVRSSGRGRTSGLDIEQMHVKAADLFRVRDGKVTRLAAYWDRDRALADLGLE